MDRMITKLLLALFMVSALYAATRPMYSLYTDRKGKKVGDVLTVMVMESAEAQNKAQTKTDKSQDFKIGSSAGTGPLDFIPGMGVQGGTDVGYNGQGSTSRNGALKATVSVRIEEVMDNGNLRIYGVKEVTLNEERETLEVSGILRPEDISSQNTVFSYKLAEAVIKYSGDGVLSDAEEAGLITRFFNWLF